MRRARSELIGFLEKTLDAASEELPSTVEVQNFAIARNGDNTNIKDLVIKYYENRGFAYVEGNGTFCLFRHRVSGKIEYVAVDDRSERYVFRIVE